MFDGDISNFGAEFTDELTTIFDNGFVFPLKNFGFLSPKMVGKY